MKGERLDAEMVNRGLISGRDKAAALVMAGRVYINGVKAEKPSVRVEGSDDVTIRGELNPFVSRGGVKLEGAMSAFNVDVADQICVDIGASTGGFTDVLLRRGAKKVYAIDVGYGQLSWALRSDPRVVNLERTNARYLTCEQFAEIPTLGACDVSFISLKLILPPLLNIMQTGRCVALIKPQFEAGRAYVGKKGVVKDASVHEYVIAGVVNCVSEAGWRVVNLTHSPIRGPEGNIEFFCDINPSGSSVSTSDIEFCVKQAHEGLTMS